MSKISVRLIVPWAVGLAIVIQLVPIRRDNPPVTAEVDAPVAVMSILRRSCFDCHSHQTRWPWYSYVAPVSWLVAWDVREGRRHLDFSAWSEYPPDIRHKKLLDIADEVKKGEMPLWYYTPLHSESRMSQDDRTTVVTWATSSSTR